MASTFVGFLKRCHKDGDNFLKHIARVTGDETWVSFVNVETKEQTNQWMHTQSPNMLTIFKQSLSARKLMVTVFWDRKGVLMVEFMQQGTTMSEVYCETRRKLRRAIQNKRRGMLTSGVMLHHDNARPHRSTRTRALLENFNWELFDHPLYSPDLILATTACLPN
jgi:histone-lysine N-methyltransferase SETMAR